MKKKSFLKVASKILNSNPPKSERWFRLLYKPHQDKDDKFNQPFAGKIPDVINKTFKYIIEIDGTIHSLDHIKKYDDLKEKLFRSKGYEVIRIQAYNLESFNNAIVLLSKLKQTITWNKDIKIPIRNTLNRKVILRKKV